MGERALRGEGVQGGCAVSLSIYIVHPAGPLTNVGRGRLACWLLYRVRQGGGGGGGGGQAGSGASYPMHCN